jgi:hypothetical protein
MPRQGEQSETPASLHTAIYNAEAILNEDQNAHQRSISHALLMKFALPRKCTQNWTCESRDLQ